MEGLTAVTRADAADSESAATAMRRDGVVAIEGALDPVTIDAVREAVMAAHPEFADPSRLLDFQDNGARRFIAPVTIDNILLDAGLPVPVAVAALAGALLGEDWVVEACGMLMAFPGCPDQHPHRDGTALFAETKLGAILPPYALTVLIPLVDVGAGEGQTAFHPGTHRHVEPVADERPVTAEVPRGSCLVWDFEILHHGLAHRGARARPALYVTLCRPFWMDQRNFGGTSRIKLRVAPDAIPRLDRRYARAREDGSWAHRGLGNALPETAAR